MGTRRPDREVQLSALIDTLNDRFGTDFTLADQLFFDQVPEAAVKNASLSQAARANDLQNFAPVFDNYFENFLLKNIDGNERIFAAVMNNEELRAIVVKSFLESIYDRLRQIEASNSEG